VATMVKELGEDNGGNGSSLVLHEKELCRRALDGFGCALALYAPNLN